MKPIKFRIENYKSIKDSGECYFERGYTVLAGKNESGKTTILEALRDFDKNKQISSESKSLFGGNNEPKVTVWFELDRDEIEDINEKFNYTLKNIKNKNTIALIKIIGADNYEFDCEFTSIRIENLEDYWEHKIDPMISTIVDERGELNYVKYLVNGNINNRIEVISNLVNGNKITELENKQVELSTFEEEVLNELMEKIDSYEEAIDSTESLVQKLIEKRMPHFVFYSSFNDVFPDEINIEEIKNSEFAIDLEKISQFNIDSIIDGNKQTQSNHQIQVNTEFTDIFKKYWTQDNIKLVVEKDGERIYFWIEENGMRFAPSQRSQGQQWFLSFYIKVVARMQEDIPNVILIDEPGLFLHAKAQKDMLKTLEEQFKDNLIVFSTHSPYLIEENKLNHIRLIEKENNETVIHSKTWAKIKDTETLTPILTAIGLGLGDGISDRGRNNIICEGMEDVFYLRAFKKAINSDLDINFINGDGAAKIHYIGRILESWQCKVMYIFDNDRAGRMEQKKLIDKEFVSSNDILMVTDKSDSSTVDLLSQSDFKKYVLREEVDVDIEKNSVYISNKKIEKPLIARNFLNNISDVELDLESTQNIECLFEKIERMIRNKKED